MKTKDGREAFVAVLRPLDLALTGDLLRAVADVARRHGYTDLTWQDDTRWVVGTPPNTDTDTNTEESPR